MDRAQAIQAASEVLRQFPVVKITVPSPVLGVSGSVSEVRCRPRLSGTGTAIAQIVMDRSNDLRQETVLVWRRKSWKPRDWKLASIAQPELEFDRSWIETP